MRTTLSVDDELLAEAKRRAALRGVSLGSVVEEALRRELSRRPEEIPAPVIPVFTRGTGAVAGVDLASNRAVHELLDEELEQRR